ncbi:dipeptide epimerase [Sphingobacterium alkalisoli]|uniref:Dipeptide epimerase n=1 Tax=Sphingobacterium alkalisoli TaxID=1874115 RepID=A0A4U0GU57_9SPHI|nr:dipeptide epimerase [Sphingobacterium alkalisoli]TJY62416.1 dipeptide epimerase [Sphingobacterium alkalisoli]GGH29608.1 muconate cycloisomerase [Sphingobacterium alkalisoli]
MSLSNWETKKMGKFTLRYQPYTLEMKHVFTVASFSRNTTPVVLTELEYDGIIGYGEASMPPYLGESQESVVSFLKQVDLGSFNSPFQTEEILSYVDALAKKNTAAKAAVDIALHDLLGKIMNQPFYKIWGLNPDSIPPTSYTIGIDTEEMIRKKVSEAGQFKILKIKLGLATDKMIINTIRSVTDVPLCADVNQGWKNKEEALEMAYWLAEQNVAFLEQPMPKEQIDDNAWLTAHSPIPTIADEGCQRLSDVTKLQGVYTGINIKLMKCTGMREAKRMAELARSLDMKVMLGCMTETSCAISAASQLAPLVDWADLDGALLIGNDIYSGMIVTDGICKLPNRPGIGIIKN